MRFLRSRARTGAMAVRLARLRRHDRQLVASAARTRIPTRAQFRYFFRFMTRREFWMWAAGCSILVIGCVLAFLGYARTHRIIVPAVGGEYTEGVVGSPRFVNPLFATTDADRDLSRLIFAGLLATNADGTLEPDLAEQFHVTTSSATYTVTLREHLRWHDGEPITADDVIFTVERIQDGTAGSPQRSGWQGVSARKSDDRTVVFTVNRNYPAFPYLLTTGILPRHVWKDVAPQSMRLADANLHPIGAGPFMFNALTKSRTGSILRYSLTRNTQYHRSAPFIETLSFAYFPDIESTLVAFTNQQIDGIHFVPRSRVDDVQKRSVDVHTLPLPQYTALFFNTTQFTAAQSVGVRRALALAVNKQEIVNRVLLNKGTALSGPMPPGTPGYRSGTDPLSYNVEQASKELTTAGWSEISRTVLTEDDTLGAPASQQVFRKNKKGDILTVAITTVDTPEAIESAQAVQTYWQRIGVMVTIKRVAPDALRDQILKDRSYDVLLFGQVLGEDLDPYPFWHSSQAKYPGLNFAQYVSSGRADVALDQARATDDLTVKAQRYQSFQEQLDKDIPAIFLYNPSYVYVQRKSVHTMIPTRLITPADRFTSVTSWYIETSGAWK
ncbi:MAG: peptide ABC transporter substrate-binding protein [Patescibacteria group bacterium]